MLQSPIPEIILILFGISVFLITLYTFGEFHLGYILVSKNKKKRFKPVLPSFEREKLPSVTVQLPMFNERYVAEAVIDASAKLDYPGEKLEIQVVDDSDDETLEIVDKRVAYWENQGVDIKVVRRTNRSGYKAGALAEATPYSKGDFLAVFDADFRPKSDFLLKSIPYFQNEQVGIVQGRWGHVNREFSLLTKSQSLFLDMFFMVEQQARSLAGYFLRFNGSGGIWRKKCIEDAGGWSSDTLSEDLDLAFRAQLKDWEVIYDDTLDVPAEVPVNLVDFKAQQYRWAKGKAQVIKKLSGKLWNKKMPLLNKMHLYFDLFNIFVIPALVCISLISIPIMHIVIETNAFNKYFAWGTIGLINVLLPPWFGWMVLKRYNNSVWKTFVDVIKSIFPLAFLLLGITITQLVSIFDAYFTNNKVFHRTSKYNIVGKEGSLKNKVYAPKKVSPITYLESALVLYFSYGIYLAFEHSTFGFLHFHVILVISFALSVLYSFRQA
jgi:cellulose synthase/poly-beta-1,6-N-acetylglucosamine synthase-like glycosyltransferase